MRTYFRQEIMLPRLENGDIDYSALDIGNDWVAFPLLYENTEDILKYINTHNLDYPVIRCLLEEKRRKSLDITDLEEELYFDEIFHRVCDICRIPFPQTDVEMREELDLISMDLIKGGLECYKEHYFSYIRRKYEEWKYTDPTYGRHLINYYRPEVTMEDEIERFYIATDKHSVTPFYFDDKPYSGRGLLDICVI